MRGGNLCGNVTKTNFEIAVIFSGTQSLDRGKTAKKVYSTDKKLTIKQLRVVAPITVVFLDVLLI